MVVVNRRLVGLTRVRRLQVLCPGRYNGPQIAAQVVEKYFGDRKEDTNILDVAAGTGLVGEKVGEDAYA